MGLVLQRIANLAYLSIFVSREFQSNSTTGKRVSFLTEPKANTVNARLLCEIVKISIGNKLSSTLMMKESPTFYPF